MQKLKILNTRDIKRIREIMIDFYGAFFTDEYAYLQNEKNKIYLINKDLAKIDISKLRVDKIGLYLAEVKGNSLRLSKEGVQLLAKEAKGKLKNVVELDKEEIKKYFNGEDLNKNAGVQNKFVLLSYLGDVFSCAKYKDGVIMNYLPKIHRGEVIL